jgi:hypothetical protein
MDRALGLIPLYSKPIPPPVGGGAPPHCIQFPAREILMQQSGPGEFESHLAPQRNKRTKGLAAVSNFSFSFHSQGLALKLHKRQETDH